MQIDKAAFAWYNNDSIRFTVHRENTMKKRFEAFTVLIAEANRCIRRIKTEEMAEFSLKSPHVSCIYYLYEIGPMTARELCEICAEDKANLSRSVEELKEKGLIAQTESKQKRYKEPLVLTELGHEVGEKVSQKIDGVLDLAGEGLSEENRKIFYESLALITRNLQKLCDRYDGA